MPTSRPFLGEGLRFRRATPRSDPRSLRGMVLMLLVVTVAITTRGMWMGPPEGLLVEVLGDVPSPGTYLVQPATVQVALRAAGAESDDQTVVQAGAVIVRSGDTIEVRPPSQPLLVGLPINVNATDSDALQAIPGIGPSLSVAIVADRDRRGPFYAVGDLRRVKGVGGDALDAMRPFVTVGEPGERPPFDLNRATAVQLEWLPGIGPVTAARIVVDRDENGLYTSLDELQRVHGVGPKTVDALRGRVEVFP